MQLADIFQSTLSMRRATHKTVHALAFVGISIHALHEESDSQVTLDWACGTDISIHALHEESDASRSSWRNGMRAISIHALHEESDTGV